MGIADINLKWLVIKWRFTEMLWSLLSCLHEGKCAYFLECWFSFMEKEKQSKKGTTRAQLCDSQLHVSVRCKVMLKSEMCWTSAVAWVSWKCTTALLHYAKCLPHAKCSCWVLLFGTADPYFKEKMFLGIKPLKLLYILLQMNAFSALRIVAVAEDHL